MRTQTPLIRGVTLFVVALVGALSVPENAGAQPAEAASGADVEVRSIKFSRVRAPGGGEAWLETVVEVGVQANPAAGGAAARFADRVEVTLSLGVRNRDGEFGFFRASAEAVTLTTGRAAFRFYLPPEVVDRDQINTDPAAVLAEISVRGRPLPPTAAAASASLRSAEALRSFKDRVAQAAPLNDGVLVPQFLSPFVGNYPADTPSFVRRGR